MCDQLRSRILLPGFSMRSVKGGEIRGGVTGSTEESSAIDGNEDGDPVLDCG